MKPNRRGLEMGKEPGNGSSNSKKETQAMKTKIRMGVVLAAAVLIAGFVAMSYAACPCGQLVGNSALGMQKNVPGVPDDGSGTGTIITKFWSQGDYLGRNSGSLPTTQQILNVGDTYYSILSDWGKFGTVGECTSSMDRTIFLYSIENGGSGKYILMSAMYAPYFSGWDFDSITNGGGKIPCRIQNPISIPEPVVRGVKADETTLLVGIEWAPIDNLKGFYDLDPQVNLITGIVVRYYLGSEAPSSFKSADWHFGTFIEIGPYGADPGFARVEVPNVPGVTAYFALTLVFDGDIPSGGPAFTETGFVGLPVSLTPGPVGGPSFASVSAARVGSSVEVHWTMASENSTVSYQVFAAPTRTGKFVATGGTILQAPSAGGAYTTRVAYRSGTDYFKVAAKATSGLITCSAVVRATGP
jgi:hypothetical protein